MQHSETQSVVSGPFIQTYGGAYIDLLHPDCSVIEIEDIAHGLSNVCRFAGQCRYFYSVAQHCCMVHDNAPEDLKWAALMHDAAEAFIGDMARPLKQMMPEYRDVESRLEDGLFARFNVENTAAIKGLDFQALAAERRDLMPATAEEWVCLVGIDPFPRRILPWQPFRARSEFLTRARGHL